MKNGGKYYQFSNKIPREVINVSTYRKKERGKPHCVNTKGPFL